MPFAANPLTHDRETFEYFEGQVAKRPELNLGGPSVRWLIEALKETAELVSLKAPAVPALTYLGSQEAIVDPARIRDRMASAMHNQYSGTIGLVVPTIDNAIFAEFIEGTLVCSSVTSLRSFRLR